MWQVALPDSVRNFWRGADRFVEQFLDYALAIQKRNLSDAELEAAVKEPPGELGQGATPTVKVYLVKFARCPELALVVKGFRRAAKRYPYYLTYPDHPLLKVSPETQDLLHDAFAYFYGSLINTKSFRETYMGLQGEGRTGLRYRELFGEVHRTCPYCDLELIAKVPNSEIDHLLPKAQHPLFAIYGGNLVVSCRSCNGGVKRTTPIGHKERTVENLPIFHPFHEQAADAVRLRFNRDVTKVWVRGSKAPGSLSAAKALHWARVFGLEKQYAEHLPSLRSLRRHLRDQARQTCRRVLRNGGLPDIQEIYEGVLSLEEQRWQEQRRHEEGSKLRLDFFHHLRTNLLEEELRFLHGEVYGAASALGLERP